MSGTEHEIYTFDRFQLDAESGVLLRDGEPIALQWKSFETLLVLVRSDRRLISRNELMEAVWPDAFVEENNLSQHIRAIRKAIGDGENGNRFIETVPRRGFRFLPEVKRIEAVNADKLALRSDSDLAVTKVGDERANENVAFILPVRKSPRSWPIFAAAVIALSVGVGAVTYWLTRTSPTERRVQYASKIRLAGQALDASNLPLLKELLDVTTPRDGEEDLRGFEWGYLARQLAERTASQPMVLQHDGWINEVAYSKDGKLVAAASNDARIWDVATGKQILTINEHTKGVASVAITPDGTKVVTGGFDLSAKLWDVSTGKLLWTIEDPDTPIAMGLLSFSSDGKELYTESANRKIRRWDVSTGKEFTDQRVFLGLRHPFAWSPDGKYIAGLTQEGWSIDVKEIATGRAIVNLKRDIGFSTDVTFAPDASLALVKGSENIAYLWELPSGKELKKFEDVTCKPIFSPDGKSIAMCSKDAIKLWDIENRIETAVLRGHVSDIKNIDFSPDGLKLASGGGGGDNTVRIWNVPKTESRGILRAHTKGVGSLTFSPDGKTMASTSGDKTVKLWDVETERVRLPINSHTESVITAAFSHDGLTLATADDERKIKLSDVVSGREKWSIDSQKPATVLRFSPDGKLLATAHWWHDDRKVHLWDTAGGVLVCSVDTRGDSGAWGLEFSTDGKQFITATPPDDVAAATQTEESAIRFWETASCREISAIFAEPATGFALAVVGGKLRALQLLNSGRSLKLLDIESKKELTSFTGHASEMMGYAFSPDGKRLFTSDVDGLTKIWDVATGQELLSFKLNAGEANTIAFSPNGNVLAGAGDGGIIRLWRANEIK